MAAIKFNDTIGIFTMNNKNRLDIGDDGTKGPVSATHDSWSTRLIILSLTGKKGPIQDGDEIGIFSADGKYLLDLGTDAMQDNISASHVSWATKFKIVSMEDPGWEGPICFGDRVRIFTSDKNYIVDIGTDAMKKSIPASHDSWATRICLKHQGTAPVLDYKSRYGNKKIYYYINNSPTNFVNKVATNTYKDLIMKAFSEWEYANGYYTFELSDSDKDLPNFSLYFKPESYLGSSSDNLAEATRLDNRKGRIYINDNKTWSDTQVPLGGIDDGTLNLKAVIMHEIGHLVGLRHLPYKDSIMYSRYNNERYVDPATLAVFKELYPAP